MAFDAFLKIDGIPGESTDSKHKEWIEILSFHHGLSQPIVSEASSHGARSSGRVDIQDARITKAVDKATPKLALACCKGTHVATVAVEFCRAGGEKQKYLEYKLSDVLISSTSTGGTSKGNDALPLEEVSFRFGKIEWTYTQLDDKGSAKGNVAAQWSLVENKGA